MNTTAITALAAAALLAFAAPARADIVEASVTHTHANHAVDYDIFFDRPTGFVFVRLPQGWRFVGKDVEQSRYTVFHDAPTGLVFVRLQSGWKFAGQAGAANASPDAARFALLEPPGAK